MDRVMDAVQQKKYTFDRKLHPSSKIRHEQMEKLSKVILHNAKKNKEIENNLSGCIKYFPEKSTEAHFWNPEKGELHVINARGTMRLFRDRDLVNSLSEVIGREIELVIDDYQENRAMASRRFEKFAFLLVSEVFNNIDFNKVKKQKKLSVILGPHDSLDPDGIEVIKENKNDYLNYKILKIDKKTVIFFDYIFADQAKNILTQLYSMTSSYLPGAELDIFHFGKIGILNPELRIGSICIPIAALDERKVMNGDKRTYPIHNQLEFNKEVRNLFKKYVKEPVNKGTTINMTSVLNQTRKSLELSLNSDGDFLDMEWSVMASLDHGYHSNYPDIDSINYFFAGVGSDKPLEGRTLAETAYPKEKESKIAKAFIDIIKVR